MNTPVISSRKSFLCKALFIIAVILFVYNSTNIIELPGLQLDEANHPAFVPGMFSRDAAQLPHFRYPDNILSDRFPIFGGSVYNTTMTSYTGLPIYAIFGFTVKTLRLHYTVFAIITLFFCVLPIYKSGQQLTAAITMLLLATSPLFIFMIRSQANMLVFTTALISISFAAGFSSLHGSRRKLMSFLTGLAVGLACSSYFVAWFCLLPGIIFMMTHNLHDNKVFLRWNIFGFLTGVLHVIYASLCVFFVKFNVQQGLNITAPTLLMFVCLLIAAIAFAIIAVCHKSLSHKFCICSAAIFGLAAVCVISFFIYHHFKQITTAVIPIKVVNAQNSHNGGFSMHRATKLFANYFFTAAPLGFTGTTNFSNAFAQYVLITILLIISAVKTCTIDKKTACLVALSAFLPSISMYTAAICLAAINYHHLLVIVPSFFLLISICVSDSANHNPSALSKLTRTVSFVLIFALITLNQINCGNVISSLKRTGGTGYHNEMFSKLPEIYRQKYNGKTLIFADWGAHLQFLFLTEGKIPYKTYFANTEEWLCDRKESDDYAIIVCNPSVKDNIISYAKRKSIPISVQDITSRTGTTVYSIIVFNNKHDLNTFSDTEKTIELDIEDSIKGIYPASGSTHWAGENFPISAKSANHTELRITYVIPDLSIYPQNKAPSSTAFSNDKSVEQFERQEGVNTLIIPLAHHTRQDEFNVSFMLSETERKPFDIRDHGILISSIKLK